MAGTKRLVKLASWVIPAACACLWGCTGLKVPIPADLPNEKAKMALPPYMIEPPDILLVNAVRLVPKPPYKIQPLDIILVQFPATQEALDKEQFKDLLDTGRVLSGQYTVEAEGDVNLGVVYGRVPVSDMTVEEAKKVIEARVRMKAEKKYVDLGKVNVALSQSRGMQQVLGPHLVRPDGTIGLGTYGSTFVTGLTIDAARAAVEAQLAEFILNPEVSVDVMGFNSKVYYVISDGGGFGEQVVRIPSYGNETVLDAIANVGGLGSIAHTSRIWIARPGPPDSHKEQILPVDWRAITRGGVVKTNYQVFPGDRIYVQAKPIIALDQYLTMFIAPLQRTMGGIILGTGTFNSLKFVGTTNGLGGGGGFGR